MYRIDRNNFHKKNKNSTIYTPSSVSNFIYSIIEKYISKEKIIIDPCVGTGKLLEPWIKNNYKVFGIDIENQGFKNTLVKNYLSIKKNEIPKNIGLIIMNPPFNIDDKTKKYIHDYYGGRPFLPEVWLKKSIELIDKDIPIVMFTPYGFRLNQTLISKRYKKFLSNEYPSITSIISLPKNIFKNILFHSEILIFNLPKLKGHYFYEQ